MVSRKFKVLVRTSVYFGIFIWFFTNTLVIILWILEMSPGTKDKYNFNNSPYLFWFIDSIILSCIFLYVSIKEYLIFKNEVDS